MFASNTSQVSNGAVYVEDCFVSWLSTGNGTSRTVTGPDMTLGGLSITKSRSAATGWHWVDTARGAGLSLSSNTTSAQATESTGVTAFTATGTSIGAAAEYNTSGATYVDYLLKKQPKFFDVVTYTGTGASNTISHNLASTPGCIIFKRTDSTGGWFVYHNYDTTGYLLLNQTVAFQAGLAIVTSASSTTFTLPAATANNTSGATYVAYLFAHNAGGFGLSGTDNVISCGSFTTDGSGNATVNLGYEPQWVLTKNTTGTGNWAIRDTMRGLVCDTSGSSALLAPNTSNAESTGTGNAITATGMQFVQAASSTYIYIAIRRGPMKVPTTGTSVFGTRVRTGDDTSAPTITPTTAMVTDMTMTMNRSGGAGGSAGAGAVGGFVDFDRLRGSYKALYTISTNAEPGPGAVGFAFDRQNGVIGNGLDSGQFFNYDTNNASYSYINYFFRRAPGFFDEVCYTGTGVARTVAHNLAAVPELIITKTRALTGGGSGANWAVYHSAVGNTKVLYLNGNNAASTASANWWNNTTPTSSVFTVGIADAVNASATALVAYLFASCPGVSKVGSYTGTGTTLQINCGFTAGARFVLIKRTDSTGDWYVWDSARGIVAGNDPYLLLNSTAAEVTSTDYVDTYSAGFEISSTAPAAINASGGTFIYLAIA